MWTKLGRSLSISTPETSLPFTRRGVSPKLSSTQAPRHVLGRKKAADDNGQRTLTAQRVGSSYMPLRESSINRGRECFLPSPSLTHQRSSSAPCARRTCSCISDDSEGTRSNPGLRRNDRAWTTRRTEVTQPPQISGSYGDYWGVRRLLGSTEIVGVPEAKSKEISEATPRPTRMHDIALPINTHTR